MPIKKRLWGELGKDHIIDQISTNKLWELILVLFFPQSYRMTLTAIVCIVKNLFCSSQMPNKVYLFLRMYERMTFLTKYEHIIVYIQTAQISFESHFVANECQ